MRFPFEKQWIIPDRPPTQPDCFVIPSYALKDRSTPTKPTIAQIKLAAEWWQRFPRCFAHHVHRRQPATGHHQRQRDGCLRGAPGGSGGKCHRRGSIPEHVREPVLRHADHPGDGTSGSPRWSPWTCTRGGAVATARKMGWDDFYWLSVYSSGEPAYGYKWFQTHSRFTLYLYELLAMVYSKMAGWV